MKKMKITILVLVILLLTMPVFGQEFGTGAIPEPTDKKPIPMPSVNSRGNTSLPRSVSHKQYSPRPENQGSYSTAVAWATTTALTISESISKNRTTPQEITNNAFSPFYVYAKVANDPNFNRGMFFADAFEFLKKTGAVRRLPIENIYPWKDIPLSLYPANAKHYKIKDYYRLFSNTTSTVEEKVNPVKKSLFEKKPVIIAFKLQTSFFFAKDGIWQSVSGQPFSGNHAMCVIGYDDDKYGGAFELQNSWGEDWGNNGFIWVSYKDFAEYVYEAYEMVCNF